MRGIFLVSTEEFLNFFQSIGKIVFQNDHQEPCSVHTLDGENEVEIKEEYLEGKVP